MTVPESQLEFFVEEVDVFATFNPEVLLGEYSSTRPRLDVSEVSCDDVILDIPLINFIVESFSDLDLTRNSSRKLFKCCICFEVISDTILIAG